MDDIHVQLMQLRNLWQNFRDTEDMNIIMRDDFLNGDIYNEHPDLTEDDFKDYINNFDHEIAESRSQRQFVERLIDERIGFTPDSPREKYGLFTLN